MQTDPNTPPLDETFAVEDGFLVRRVVPKRGVPYQHRCPLATFEEVGHSIDEMTGAGFGLKELGERTKLPWTQVNVALAFMKERGCVVPVYGRKHKAGTGGVHLDAMIEWHALAEGG
jgi:hypothetical protein